MCDAMKEVEILLVEDNPTDAELAIRALKKSNLANKPVGFDEFAKTVSELGLYWLRVNQPPVAS